MLEANTANVSYHEVRVRTAAFGHAWEQTGAADIAAFLPPADHPDYLEILCALVRRDLAERRARGRHARLEEYVRRYPTLFADPRRVQDLAFEDYRARAERGEAVTPELFQLLFDVDAKDWPPRSAFAAPPTRANVKGGESDFLQLSFMSTPVAKRPDPAYNMAPEAGEKFLDFDLVRELGRGAVARVFLARQAHLAGRLVVVKVSPHSDNEPHTLAQMQHTNIVPIYSVHLVGPLQVVCMPYYGSTTLAKIIADFGKVVSPTPTTGRDLLRRLYEPRSAEGVAGWRGSEVVKDGSSSGTAPPQQSNTSPPHPAAPETVVPESAANLDRLAGLSRVGAALWLTARIADGLAHAHERGILHCDLKPANVLLSNDGQPMLLDFNVSIQAHLPGSPHPARVGGTLPYMAPEHLEALRVGETVVGASCDLYSLGVILYELLTGTPPFSTTETESPDLLELLRDQRRVPPVPPSRFNPAVTPAVNAIVRKLLDPDPAKRYASARDLRDDLERQLADRPLRHARDRSVGERFGKWRRRNPRTAAALAVAAFALIVLVLPATAVASRAREISRRAEQVQRAEAVLAQQTAADEIRGAAVLLSTRTGDRALLDDGLKSGAAVVARYAVAGGPDWKTSDSVRLLPDEKQTALCLDLGELLLLMARGERLRAVPDDVAAAQRALGWNRLADRCFPPDQRPQLLARQRAELVALVPGEEHSAGGVPSSGLGSPLSALRSSPLDLYHDGLELAAQARYAEALTHLLPFTEQRPTHVMGWYVRGVCHAGVGQLPDAVSAFTLCASLHPNFRWAYFQRGLARLQQSRFDQAEKDFTRALDLQPDWTSALINRALARDGRGDRAGAEADLTAALARPDAPSRVYFVRAKVRRAAGNAAGADEDRAAGMKQTPTDAQSWTARGFWRLAADPNGALNDFEEAIKANPRQREALQNKALVLADHLNRPRDAVAVLDRLLELYPNFAEARAGRGVYLARLGERDRAKHDAADCLRDDPSPFLLYQLAGLYAQLSRTDATGADKAESLRLLARAFRAGFDQFNLIDGDPDVAPVRSDPAFQRLVAGAKSLVLPKR